MDLRKMMNKTRIALTAAIVLLAVYGFSTHTPNSGSSDDDGPVGTRIGDQAPELSFYNTDSTKVLALSSLRGKYVLVDFWASWCGPCRRENPSLVHSYEKYSKAKFKSGKGFTIYSVSLDKDRASWKKAITQDKLSWPQHVSDLKAWSSAGARLYGVTSIPMNFLLDPNGIIVAKNLRGTQLDQALDKYVKSF